MENNTGHIQTKLLQLLQRYEGNTATLSEMEELFAILDKPEGIQACEDLLARQLTEQRPLELDREHLASLAKGLIRQRTGTEMPSIATHFREERDRSVHFIRRFRWVAAAVFLFAVATTYLLVTKKEIPAVVYTGNVAPGKLGSKIKLSNNQVIMLDTVKDGLIAVDGSMKILKKDGKIIYEGSTDEVLYNEVFAEKGRQSEAVVLPDGSTAWLNAGSSLRYPLHFAANQRLVTMTGEVYYEVVHNAKQPFRVKAGMETIEDIGTSFNVNSYTDEPAMVTTLVEGSIKIQDKILQPGQQYAQGQLSQADVTRAVAWHKGVFSFVHADISAVMRQMARWYNVEIRYEGTIPDETFTGDMERSLSLADALDYLKRMRVRFRIEEDKRIVVMP